MQIMNSLTEDPASKRNVIWYSGFAESPIMQRAWQSQIEPNAHSTIASAMSSIYHHDSTSKGLQPPPVGPASQQRYMPDRPLSCRPAYFEPYSAPPGLNSGFFAPGMFNVAPHLQLIPEYRHQHYSVPPASWSGTSTGSRNVLPRDILPRDMNPIEKELASSLNLTRALQYKCGYCGVIKTSTSGISNTRTRIRCNCGGGQQDGQLRLHGKWFPVDQMRQQVQLSFKDFRKKRKDQQPSSKHPEPKMPLAPHSNDGLVPSQTGTDATPAAPAFSAQRFWPKEESFGHQMAMMPEQPAQAQPLPAQDRSEPIWTSSENSASLSISTRNADSLDESPQPVKRMKTNTHSSAPSFHLCNVPKTLLRSDTVEQEIPATLDLDLLATVCHAESSAAAFGTGNANGRNPERLEVLTGKPEPDGADGSSKMSSHLSFVAHFGFVFLAFISGMMKFTSDMPNPVVDIPNLTEMSKILDASGPISISESLPEVASQLLFWLSPVVCLMGAFWCWYLPVQATTLLRKLNLDLSDHRDGVAADTYLILAYIYVVIPLFQLAEACQAYLTSGSLQDAIIRYLTYPLILAVGVYRLQMSKEMFLRTRRVLVLIGIPSWCILQQHASYTIWWSMIARFQILSVVVNTSLIDHLQESLFVLAGVLVVSPPGLFAIAGIFPVGVIGMCAKILCIQQNIPWLPIKN